MKPIAQILLIFMVMIYSTNARSQIQFGVFADCQFCDCQTAGTRFYRNSPAKLNDCISEFNKNENLEFIVGLGDFIDRDFASFATVNSVLNKSKNEVFHVVGNHDFSVEKDFFDKVPEQLKLTKTYYAFTKKDWHFIFLNGNEITFQSADPGIILQAKKLVDQLTAKNKPNNQKWNGGIGDKQIEWLDKQLQLAQQKNYKVAIFCHYPLLPLEIHALWNSGEILNLLNKYNCVKMWMNGHNHAGNYIVQNGIHFVTLKGMVETENENAFSEITLYNNKILITGFGREENKVLPLN